MLQNHSRRASSAAVFVLCALFFLFAAGVVLLGSSLYRGVSARAEDTARRRTALSYLANQLRAADAGGVSVISFGGKDALLLTDGEDDRYTMRLYCSGGSLRELYAECGLSFAPEDGTAVFPLDGLLVSADGQTLTVVASAGGEEAGRLIFCPRSGLLPVGGVS